MSTACCIVPTSTEIKHQMLGYAIRNVITADERDRALFARILAETFRLCYIGTHVPEGETLVEQFDWESIRLPQYDIS